MTEAFWTLVREVFDVAADAPMADRDAVIRTLSHDDREVIRAVGELLAADAPDFLSQPPSVPDSIATMAARIAPGALIGGYRVVRLAGRGGMGEVYEGVRATRDFDKRVAIKMLRSGIASPDAIARFERERRILAGLDHPNIAALLDGSVMPDGTPFLVMEFVEGERITTWCDTHRLGLAARLALFRQVCDAVAYAHRHLVVHRDLKPGNIFVTGDGIVKLLDFGIAKVLADSPAADEAETRPEARALTRDYAAPEHLTNGPITTGTDVYALGLLLFELLTGRRPFSGRDLPFAEFVRLVTTRDPPTPSSVAPDAERGLAAPRDRARLRGDLDAIVVRALRPDPGERYGTVAELLAELRRFDEGRPVAAMRGRRLYQFRKFVGRNRGAIGAAGAIALALTAGILAASAQARRAGVQRRRAEATSQFLTEMLQAVDPADLGRGVLMADVLDSAARRIDRTPPQEPDVEASLRDAIGASYIALGNYAAAEPHLRRALAIREQRPADLLPLESATEAMGGLYDARGEFVRADTFYRRALGLLPASGDTAVARHRADLLNQLARMQSQQGNYVAAIALLREAISRRSEVYGPNSREVAHTTSDLGVTLLQKGDVVQAESAETQAIRIASRLTPPDRLLEGEGFGRLATALDLGGHPGRSDSAYRGSLAILDSALGSNHPDVTWIRYNYAGSLLDWGKPQLALAEADQVLSARGRTLPETHPMVSSILMVKGQALARLGHHAAAIAALKDGLALRRRYLAPAHWLIGSAQSILGAELWAAGQRDAGRTALIEGCRIVVRAVGPENPKAKDAIARLHAADRTATCE